MPSRLWKPLAWTFAGWVVVLIAPAIASILPINDGRTIPLVSLPWTPSEPHVQSDLAAFFRALTIGSLAALVIEPAKYALARPGRYLYLLLLVHQLVLIIDLFRIHLRDWWVALLASMSIVSLSTYTWRNAFLAEFPWFSLLTFVGVACTALRVKRRASEGVRGAPDEKLAEG